MASERDRKRKEISRRAAGAVDRKTYESRSAARQRPWEALGMSRATWYRAGKPSPSIETSPSVLQENLEKGELETGSSVLLMAKPTGPGVLE